ncbi:MAG: MerR family transcriptional regulator [Clostridia bacterium]|nr:MerR family transcriptional regulator [Clostridia bacterium]
MYKIGELSRLCALPVKTLRFYDAEGLLVPDHIDKFTGYRYYSAARLADCNRIVALKALGFSLEEIRAQLRAAEPCDVLAQIEAKRTALRAQMAEDEARLRRLEAIRAQLMEGETDMLHLVIRSGDTLRAAAKRDIYPTKEAAVDALAALRASLPPALCGRRAIIINYETEYRERDFDLAVCVELTGRLPAGVDAVEQTLDFAGDIASIVCPREQLDEAYRAMTRQLEEIPAQVIGPAYEIYHDDGTVELKVPVCRYGGGAATRPVEGMARFENDPDVIGRWEMIDIVPTAEQFRYGHPKCGHRAWLDELCFLPDGGGYWAVEGWTRGEIYTCASSAAGTFWRNPYTVREVDGHTLLFLEMQDFRDGGAEPYGMPVIWVYEKRDSVARTADGLRRRDNIDLPYLPDEAVLGAWRVHDFVISLDQFDPDKPFWAKDDLFFTNLVFLEGGKTRYTTKNGVSEPRWTKGTILIEHEEVAEAYELRTIGGREYLFVEWKTGDYTYGGGRVYWYIFVRDGDAPADARWEDDTDLPFVPDDAVLGRWVVRDYCYAPEQFRPDRQNRPMVDLHLRSLDFAPGGVVVQETKSGSRALGWTRGTLLCAAAKTAPAYAIREIEGEEYLFVEWKSGDYTRSGKVSWYVLKRG